jgi:uncharacterized small protein (DUF1192 family)
VEGLDDAGEMVRAAAMDEEPSTRSVRKLVKSIAAKVAEVERLEATVNQLRMEVANELNNRAGEISNDAAWDEMVVLLRALSWVAR